MRTMSQVIRRIQTAEGGFTLIELMIVIVVIAILTVIAYPSYLTSVRKGKRGAAKADLTSISQTMERCFTQNNTYSNCFAADTLTGSSAYSPSSGPASAAVYAVTLAVPARGQFTVTATPFGDQLKDKCGTLTLNQAGQKTPTATVDAGIGCW